MFQETIMEVNTITLNLEDEKVLEFFDDTTADVIEYTRFFRSFGNSYIQITLRTQLTVIIALRDAHKVFRDITYIADTVDSDTIKGVMAQAEVMRKKYHGILKEILKADENDIYPAIIAQNLGNPCIQEPYSELSKLYNSMKYTADRLMSQILELDKIVQKESVNLHFLDYRKENMRKWKKILTKAFEGALNVNVYHS